MKSEGFVLVKKKIGVALATFVLLAIAICSTGCGEKTDELSDLPQTPDAQQENAGVNAAPDGAPENPDNMVVVGDDDMASSDKMVEVAFASAGRANPFQPSGESSGVSQKELFRYDLIEPPTSPEPDTQASKIVTTKISGIMYDNYNPSAILNIENNDYLVRSGDVINGYKILAISPSTVTVQLGKNVYKAGVGQIVTDGDLNFNTISNLSHKFGGNTSGNKRR